jgi:uncharacterized Zn finger protein (UPF0148 family)
MPLAFLGIDGGVVGTVIALLILFLIVVYLALIYWTYLDARRRLEDPVLIACATIASVFPFIGTVVYTIVRPPEFLEDREERELELRAAELRLRQLIDQSCPYCEYPIAANYLRCPNCERRLRNPCRKCGKPLDPKWGVCPFCETEVRKERRETRRTERPTRRSRRTERTEAPRAGSSTSRPKEPSTSRSDGPSRPAQRPPVGAQGRPPRPSGGRSSRPSR